MDSRRGISRAFRKGLCLVVLVVVDLGARRAVAQQTAAAESLFEEGRRLMNSGNFAAACQKLEESQRLEPAGGTLMNLALCHEKMGRTASAWAEFKAGYALGVRDGREARIKLAKEHIERLEPTLSRVTILPGKAEVAGLEVFIDDILIGKAAWNTATPMDPGPHTIRAAAPGYKAWTQSFELAPNRASIEVAVPALEPLPALPAGPVGPGPAAAADRTGRRAVGITLMGVGVVGIGIGTVFGVLAVSKRGESNRLCESDTNCTAAGVKLNDTAIAYSWVSTASFGAGIALGLVGGYLTWTAVERKKPMATAHPSRPRAFVAPDVRPGAAGLVVHATW